jgi:hypothetical protein
LAVMSLSASTQAQSVAPDAASGILAKILSGEGKPGDATTTRSGITYRVLSNGTVEMRNPRYGTVKYSRPVPAWQRNLKNQGVGGR